jgi:hypothetical protein
MRIIKAAPLVVVASLLALAPTPSFAQTQTATARLVNPGGRCPQSDWGKTAQFTGQGCTPQACNSFRQTAIARLRSQVDRTCETFIRADSQCVKHNCPPKKSRPMSPLQERASQRVCL